MEERKKHILQRAIRELPTYEAIDAIWRNTKIQLDIDEQNSSKENEPLPIYKAPENIWDKIEIELNVQNKKKTMPELPSYQAPDFVWENIKTVLDKPELKTISIKQFYTPLRIAASIILLLSTYYLFKHTAVPDGEVQKLVSYSTEVVSKTETSDADPIENAEGKSDAEIMSMVDTYCQSTPQSCDNPYFSGLITQYKELKTTQNKLQEDDSDETEIKHSLVKIEKEKTKVLKKIIQCLI